MSIRLQTLLVCWGLIFVFQQPESAAEEPAREPPVTAAVMQLVRQGKIEAGEKLLRASLEKKADDADARLLLGRLLDFDGRPDEAVKIMQAGLRSELGDVPLLMEIGELETRLSNDGPTVTNRRGTVSVRPSSDKEAEEKFKQEHRAVAIKKYEQVLKLVPDQTDAAVELAQLQTAAKNHDAALKLWRRQQELHTDNGKITLGLAEALIAAAKSDEALPLLQKAIAQNPHQTAAHEALAKLYDAAGKPAEAKAAREQAEYYAALPPFAKLEYSAENRAALEKFSDAAAIQQWIDDPGDRATQLLAVFCWSHPHNDLETRAFAELEKRAAKNLPLLRQLLIHAHSTCTIRSTARILAKQKDPGLFEFLLQRLPGDTRTFEFDMDIAGSLGELGDPRAVQPLVEVLNPQDKKVPSDTEQMLIDRRGARARAAFALGKFNTEESKQALLAGLDNEQLRPFCNAALFRLTNDKTYREAIGKLLLHDEIDFASFKVAEYLRDSQAPEMQTLLQEWEKRVKAELEKREKERQKNQPAPE